MPLPPQSPLSPRPNHFQTDILTTLIHTYFTPAMIREMPPLHINKIGGHISQYYMTHYEKQRQTRRPCPERNVCTCRCRKGNGKDQITLNAAQTGFKAHLIWTAEVEDCLQIFIDCRHQWSLLTNTCVSHRRPALKPALLSHWFAPCQEIFTVFSVAFSSFSISAPLAVLSGFCKGAFQDAKPLTPDAPD